MPRRPPLFPSYHPATVIREANMTHHRLSILTAVSLFALSLPVGAALAAGEPDPPPRNPPIPQQNQKPAPSNTTKDSKKKNQQKSEQEFRDGYRAAYALVQAGEYKAAFAAFKALDADDTPDVANYLGYTARKLGDYEASRFWYERALASDPKHVRTWQYYGMWHVEQGNMLKAADFLEQIRLICGGTGCKEYQDLKGGIEGTVVY
jgi:tetratricopeptide (TPR) repeat protein